jgi:acyl carrier protein
MPDTTARAEQVREIIVDHLSVDAADATDTANLADDLGADSLDCVELTMAVEGAFNISVSDVEAEECLTVGDWQALVERKLA